MLIAQGAIDASKIGVSIALRYACARPQFGAKRIMEYLTHQRRLLPALATTYAMQLQSLRLKVPLPPVVIFALSDECTAAAQLGVSWMTSLSPPGMAAMPAAAGGHVLPFDLCIAHMV